MKLTKSRITHLVMGTFIFLLFNLLFTPFIGVATALIAGLSKEVFYEELRKGGNKAKTSDVVFTITPGLLIWLIVVIINLI